MTNLSFNDPANNEDGYYTQVFRNRSELNAFIDKLQAIANEAWPEGSCKIIFELTQHEIAYLDSNGFFYKGQLIEDAGEAHRLLVEVLNAQKVLDAFLNGYICNSADNSVAFQADRNGLAAAIRALADQVASPIPDDCRYDVFNRQLDIRAKLHAIATELENAQ